MIKPTWQDKDKGRRIIFVPTQYINLDNPIQYALKKDHGTLIQWTEMEILVALDGRKGFTICKEYNLFWEDGKPDFDERRSLNVKSKD